MEIEQCRFRDKSNDEDWIGGILVDKQYIICGECGSVLLLEEYDDLEVEVYDHWVSISEEIMGD